MLVKQGIDVSFAQGLDTKTDPKRLQLGKFLRLENTNFDKGGLLQKRNGYGPLASLPDTTYSYLTTFSNNLTAIGNNIAAYSSSNSTWVVKGAIQPLSLSALPMIRNNLNQTACDSAVAPNGLVCTVYLETDGTTITNKYAIADSVTGQNIVAPIAIPVSSGVPTGGMRVFVLGSYFVIVFTNVITAVSHLQYVAISYRSPTTVGANTDIASAYIPATTLAWDGYVAGGNLYLAYNTTTGGQQVKVTYLTPSLAASASAPVTPVSFATYKATSMTVTADVTDQVNIVIYVSFYRSDTSVGYTTAVNAQLGTVMAPQLIISATTCTNIASAAESGVCLVFYEVVGAYSFDAGLATNHVSAVTVTVATSTVGTPFVSLRGVGLASKAFLIGGSAGYLAAYQSSYQPTYFLVNGSTSTAAVPAIVAKLAYQNGGGYLPKGLPSVTVSGQTAQVAYLFKDLIQAVNKNTNVPSGSQTAGIYSQTGINLATFNLTTAALDVAEIGSDLHLTGGFLWMYDGYLPVEHNFFLWPDMDTAVPTDAAAWSAAGGSIVAKPDAATNTNAYYYQVTYEWTDSQGNAFRSAPSIPIAVTTSGAGSTGSITLNIPTLRATMKVANPVKIVIYRWSVGQQNYYQVTSIASPLLNDTTVDSVQFVDTLADASILGNNLIYTTGGVVEDVNAPASNAVALFDTRLWLIDAENPDTLWYSKQVIPATPVEMSDLFTLFVPPTTGTETSTGANKTLFPMDDKLIIGRKDALLYINGTGPDNTGANSQYSQTIFITSTVGCDNQKSIVLTPQGLMFESDKGIWLLDRGLNTSYIGAPVEEFTTGAKVLSAVNVPATNQVRFMLDSGTTLTYDYFYGQWDTPTKLASTSSCIFQSLHTYISPLGDSFQETPGVYLDGSNPVLMAFKTGPIRLGELQGYQRAYFFYLLGTYISPHKLLVNIYYDYETNPSQSLVITPNNFSTAYGSGPSQSPYGQGSPYGGPKNSENWRVFLQKQRCSAINIEVQEIFDATLGVPAGAGLTLSGINIVCAFKKAFRPQSAATSVG